MKKRATVGRRRSLEIFRIAGIRIRIDVSWLLIFALVLWSVSAGYLPSRFPDRPQADYWTIGLLGTLLFFGSILIHELAHSLVAMRAGIRIPEITLFLFGGVSHMSEEPRSPGLEFRVAIVGPLASFALAGLFGLLAWSLGDEPPTLTATVLGYLAWINAALGVFNLVPGFPLDGGRVLRAFVWWWTGSLRRATRVASNSGQGFAIGLMVLGGIEVFAGALVGGLWLIFIGMFLRGMASAGYEQLVIRTALENVDVRDVMVHEPVSVGPDLSLRELVERHFLRDGFRGYPVVDGSKVLGVVSMDDVRSVPSERFETVSVGDVMRPVDERSRIEASASLAEALRRMFRDGQGRLLVMRGDELEGLITRGGVQRFLEIHRVLGPEAEEARPPGHGMR